MLARKSRRIARRTLKESDRWWDLQTALEDDCVEALQTKMEFHEFDVNVTWVRYWFEEDYLRTECVPIDWGSGGDKGMSTARNATPTARIPITRTPLSLAVHHGAVNCVAYLKDMDARSRVRLPGSGYDTKPLGSLYAFNLCNEIRAELKENYSFDYDMALYQYEVMMYTAEYNALQLASLKYGRDSLITRLVRDERKEIAKSYKLGFAALRYYADSQRASLLLAKNDGRLLLILTSLANVKMPPELREKIVDFAFFGKTAPERKANKEKTESE